MPYRNLAYLNASKKFPSFILNKYVQFLSAKESGASSSKIDSYVKWFDDFKAALREIFDCSELDLAPNMEDYSFHITMPARPKFSLLQMADGYSSILNILMELLMRFDDFEGAVNYEQSAIVLIDDLETHLHVKLQKRALPFLTRMFPNVQFILSTHSPFVMTSSSNAVIYDLKKFEVLDNQTFYSYEAIVESFLDAKSYSLEMRRYFLRYKELSSKNRTQEEDIEFLEAKAKLELMSPASKELFIAFRRFEAERKQLRDDLR
jgi:hypothetical protein